MKKIMPHFEQMPDIQRISSSDNIFKLLSKDKNITFKFLMPAKYRKRCKWNAYKA